MAIQYKKPRRINAVSVGLVVMMGLSGYLGYCFWPAMRLSSNVKVELRDALPHVYRANLMGEASAGQEVTKIRNDLIKKLVEVSKDPKVTVAIKRDKKMVSIEASFQARVIFEGLNKTRTMTFNPSVETSAERVEWD